MGQANLPEFQQKDSRDYFIGGHPVPPFDKPEWKAADFPAAKKEAEYAAAMARTAELVPELNAALAELEGLIYSEDFCTEGGLSLDDIDLWSRLRSVTLVKGAQFGPKTTATSRTSRPRATCPCTSPWPARSGPYGLGEGRRRSLRGRVPFREKKKELILPPSSPPSARCS